MAARNILKSDIFVGRVVKLNVNDTLELTDLKEANFIVTEEVKMHNTEIEDSTEINEIYARKCVLEGVIPEIEFTDESIGIDGLSCTTADDTIAITTSTGGANGNGKVITLTLNAGDIISAFMDGNKVKIKAEVTEVGDVLPYAVSDVAA